MNKPDLQNVQGTAFALYNGVVDYSDNHRRTNNTVADDATEEEKAAAERDRQERDVSRRFEDTVLKDKALDYCKVLQKV